MVLRISIMISSPSSQVVRIDSVLQHQRNLPLLDLNRAVLRSAGIGRCFDKRGSVHSEAVWRDAGFQPRVEHKTPQMATICSLVAAGAGVALVPESLQRLQFAVCATGLSKASRSARNWQSPIAAMKRPRRSVPLSPTSTARSMRRPDDIFYHPTTARPLIWAGRAGVSKSATFEEKEPTMFFDAYVSLSQPFIRIRHSPGINLGSRYCEHPVNEAQLGKSSRGMSC